MKGQQIRLLPELEGMFDSFRIAIYLCRTDENVNVTDIEKITLPTWGIDVKNILGLDVPANEFNPHCQIDEPLEHTAFIN